MNLSALVSASAVGCHRGNYTDPGSFLAGDWNTWEKLNHSTLKKVSEAGSQVFRLSGSHPTQKTKQNKKNQQQLGTLWFESFTANIAEPGMVQLCGGRASTITEAVHHYRHGLPLLRQPPLPRQPTITERVCHYRGEPSFPTQF